MLVKLKIDVGANKAGEIIDIAEDSVARGYIAAGVAEESNQGEQMKALFQGQIAAANAGLKDELKETFRSLMEGAKSNGPPSKGVKFNDQGVPFDKIEGGAAPEDRDVDGGDTTSFGELLRLIAMARPLNGDLAERAYASKRLNAKYIVNVTRSNEDDWETSRSFSLNDGKPVDRAGTESMTGGATLGYLVRPEFINSLFSIAMEEQALEPYVRNIPVGQTNNFSWPALDQYFTPAKGTSAVYGGVQVFRRGEVDPRPSSDYKLRNIEYKITDLVGLGSLSRDLLMDNFLAADMIMQDVFGRAMAWRKDWEFFNGSDVGQPMGLLKSPATLTVSRSSSNHIVFADLVAMLAAFHQAHLKNAMWVGNQTIYTDLMAVVNGSGNYVFQPNNQITQATMPSLIDRTTSNGLKYAAQGTLLGLPIRFTEKLPALGTTGDLMLIDPTQYGVATRMGLEIGVSEHFQFNTDQITYRFKLRNDARPLWLGPYVSADSANTKFSPFVKIA